MAVKRPSSYRICQQPRKRKRSRNDIQLLITPRTARLYLVKKGKTVTMFACQIQRIGL